MHTYKLGSIAVTYKARIKGRKKLCIQLPSCVKKVDSISAFKKLKLKFPTAFIIH